MKLIVDTCVWSLLLRRQNTAALSSREKQVLAELQLVIQSRRAAILGPIRQEVLSGIRDPAQFSRTEKLLEPFRDEGIMPDDYVEAARLFNLCRNHGVQCGAVDILIGAVALRLGIGILTTDGGLMRCMAIVRPEGLLP